MALYYKKRYKKNQHGKYTNAELKNLDIERISKEISLMECELQNEIQRKKVWERNTETKKKERQKYVEYEENLDAFYKKEIKPLYEIIAKIEKDKSSYKKSLLSFLKKSELTEQAKDKVKQLEIEIANKKADFRKRFDKVKYIPEYEEEPFYTSNLESLRDEINRYKRFLEKKIEEKHKLENIKALAATTTGKAREIVKQIKFKVIRNELCPYCNNPIKEDAHLDHIYPLSKGGLSVIKNMVYICSSCNLKKGALTLNSFIKKYKLERDKIEKKLELLNKDF